MKETFKIYQPDTDVFERCCKEQCIPFKLLTADKEVYEYEIEYKHAFQLYYLGFKVALNVARQIANKHLS